MTDEFEVFIALAGRDVRVGTLWREPRRGYEATGFSNDPAWARAPEGFALEPALVLSQGAYSPAAGRAMFGSLGDSAPDTWGRRLLQRAERRQAQHDRRPPRTLYEIDYLIGVADVARVGALRFRHRGGPSFLAVAPGGVPSVVHLQRLLEATERTLRDEESDEDLRLILAPGSSLGGARPKASVVDRDGSLALAKFPKETDEYSSERWEAVALTLASDAGIDAARFRLAEIAGRIVVIIRRFDRVDGRRIPFLSAMSMLERRDGEQASYPEIVDAIARHGARAKRDAAELYRRVAFNVLVSNVDDHLRNHAFLWKGADGWVLAPAYDLNPTPVDIRERRLTTFIDLADGACDIDLLLSSSEWYGLSPADANSAIREVARVTRRWRAIAASLGASSSEIERMSSAFEHHELERALSL